MEIHSMEAFLAYWGRIRQRTERVIAAIPEQHIDWTYKAGKFTFADLIRHLAALERYMFAENVQGLPSRYPGHGPKLADGHQEVLEYFARCHQESIEILRQLGDAGLERECLTPGGAKLKVWKWLRAMIEHEIHHRGQIYIYLGMLGEPGPPLYGLTAEQVRARSQS